MRCKKRKLPAFGWIVPLAVVLSFSLIASCSEDKTVDNCLICGMPVHKYPQFATSIELLDGTIFKFCDTQCMLRASLQPDIYLAVPKENIKSTAVTSYFTGKQVKGRESFFVMGSDVVGPMGATLIALSEENEAVTFVKRHGGRIVYGVEAVSREVWEKANARRLEK